MRIQEQRSFSPGGVFQCLVDDGWTLLHASEGFYNLLGYKKQEFEELFENRASCMIHPDDLEELRRAVKEDMADGSFFSGEFRVLCKNGDVKWVWIGAELVKDQPDYFYCMFHDNTGRMEELLCAQKEAMQDSLTGVYNRKTAEDWISEKLKAEDQRSLLLVLDIDNFKGINDSFGHMYGDAVLSEVAYQLKQLVGSRGIVGRAGGDEFIIYIEQVYGREEAEWWAEKIRSTMSRTFTLNTLCFRLSGSIGAAICPEHGAEFRELFGKADIAMYSAKRRGKNRCALYSGDMEDERLACQERSHSIDSKNVPAKSFRNHIVEYIFRIFCENEDIDKAVPLLLDLVGSLIHASRGYIYEISESRGYAINTFEWCGQDIPSMKAVFGRLPHEDKIESFLAKKTENNVYICEDSALLSDSGSREWFQRRGTVSLIQCHLYENGRLAAAVGFEFCDSPRSPSAEEKEMLSLVSQTISLFLIRHRQKECLIREQEFSDRLLKQVDAQIYGIRPQDYTLVFINESMKGSANCKLGDVCYEVIVGGSRPCRNCPMNDLGTTGEGSVREFYRSKQQKWVEASASMVPWEDGEPVCMICSTDITKYRADAARIEFLSSMIPGGMVNTFLEPGYPVIFINENMLRYLGYEDETDFLSATGGRWIECIHPEDRLSIEGEINSQLECSEEYILSYRMLRKDGGLIWISDKGKLTHAQDGRKALLSLCMDITSEKEMEKQLEMYRSAARGGAFIIKVDEMFTLLYGNDIFYSVHGYTKESMEQKLENHYIGCIYEKDRTKVSRFIDEAVKREKTTIQWEMRVVTGTGEVKWLLISGSLSWAGKEMVIKGFVVDNTPLHRLLDQISQNEQRYKIALKQANVNVWEYDMKNRRLLFTNGSSTDYGFHKVVESAPIRLEEAGCIHPDSLEDFKRVAQKLMNGERTVTVDLRIRAIGAREWHWERLSYTVLPGPVGESGTIVAVGEDISRQKDAEIKYQQELQMRYMLSEGVLASCRVNLNKNKVEFLQKSGNEEYCFKKNMTYEEICRLASARIANREDYERFWKAFSRDSLLKTFEESLANISLDVRCSSAQGSIVWVNMSAKLVKDALSNDIYVYGIASNISEQKSLELSLSRRAGKDQLTGAYNRETAIEMMRDRFSQNARNYTRLVLAVFHVDHFNRQLEINGYQLADQILKELSSQLSLKYDDPKIVGRLYADEFVVLLCGGGAMEEAERTAKEINTSLGKPYLFPGLLMPVSISTGIDCTTGKADKFQDVYTRAHSAMAEVRRQGGNGCKVYRDGDADLAVSGASLEETASGSERDRSNALLLRCAMTLTSLPEFGRALEQVLEEAARYFRAAGAYVICYDKELDDFYHIYRWERGEASRERQDFLKKVCRNAAWELKKQDRTVLFSDDIMPDKKLAAARLNYGKETYGYLLVASPKVEDENFLNTLQQFITGEIARQRFQSRQDYLGFHDGLTGLRNRASYHEYQMKLVEESLISLGVVSADINGMREFNQRYGVNRGDELLKAVASAMRECFDSKYLYRFSGDEFLAVCENLTKKAFSSCVKNFKLKLRELQSFGVSMGYSWSDEDIRLDYLIRYADDHMMLAKQEYYKQGSNPKKHYNPAIQKELLETLGKGWFQMYLQPKAKVPGGEIQGAEALVRYVSPQEGTIGPDRFIPRLEQNGLVYHIDLFIFEEVCKILDRWGKLGENSIAISLNFSRSTLLREGLVDIMENIIKKYEVNRNLIEVEITESLGAVEREAIANVGREIAKKGYRLSLDDFGAKYSNMSILSAIKFDVLKLDKSLVNDLLSNKNTRIIIKNLLCTCRDMEIASVAEGVENKEQFEVLAQLGCDYVQGYYFNKPIPVEDFERAYLPDISLNTGE